MGPKTPAISLRGVGRDYGDRAGLGEVELELPEGQTLAVLGPNGSGKTTLLRLLAGLLRPSRGSAVVLGCALPGEAWRLRGRVGYLAHAPLLYRDLSARENLLLSARLHGIDAGEARRHVERLLESVAMRDRGDDRVAELSAGMAQRVAACRAVVHEPELLLLDEPDAHLDADARSLVGELVGRASGRTRVIVSHDRERLLADADLALEL